MLQMRIEGTRYGTMFVLGFSREALQKLLQDEVEITEIAEPIQDGIGLVMMAETHEQMVETVKATDLFEIEGIRDERIQGPTVELPEIRGKRDPFRTRR